MSGLSNGGLGAQPPMEDVFSPHGPHKRSRLAPPLSERCMIYVKREGEKIYMPLHLVPPSLMGFVNAVGFFYIFCLNFNFFE